ncbi:hypothetical protein [Bacillus toyonensis]|uniref:hypothetical protein n=1 Tax=Bacillus toyonensis TaxID=155322 RepID=UPI000BEF1BDE|nr:hypothetical protein [Bacillus toyonensis]PEM39216.1 hypothetical protein CN636_26335 [Bacillus toyonensis]
MKKSRKVSLQTKIVSLIITLILFVVLLLAGIFVYIQSVDTKRQVEQLALQTAKSLSFMPAIKEAFQYNEHKSTIQSIAEQVREQAGADYVIVEDRYGVMYSHSNSELIGTKSNNPYNYEALTFGGYYTLEGNGVSGPALMAKAPIIVHNGDYDQVVGVVTVEFLIQGIESNILSRTKEIILFSLAVLLAGIVGGILLARSIRKDTLGLEPNEIAEDEKQIAPPVEKKIVPTPPPVQKTINVVKVELKKKQSINIQKSKMVTATLEWETNKDLDLYCFYVTTNGEIGKAYYKNLGSSKVSPYIVLDGDSQEPGKETIRIYRSEALKYVLFAAYSAVGNGIGSFYSMKAKAVVDNHMGSVVTAPLLEINDHAYWVCIAHIDFTNSDEMKISHVESYSKDHSEASPLLYENGKFGMDVGPIEFKNEEDYQKYFK